MKGKLQFDLRRNHDTARIITVALTMAMLAVLALAAPAFAQTSPEAMSASANSADAITPSETFAPAAGAAIVAPDSGYALPPPDEGALADPSSSAATTDAGKDSSSAADAAIATAPATDGTACDALSSTPPIDLASPLPKIAPIASADWDRVGDSEGDADSGDAGNPVLEVPQAVPSPDASSGDGANQSAQGGDSSPPDEVGSVDDYQDENSTVMGVYITPPFGPPLLNPPFAAGTFGNHAPAGVPVQPNNGPMLPSGIGGVRPFAGGMNSAIMPTSPMYPRGIPMVQSFSPMLRRSSAPILGGGWNRAR